MDLTKIAQGEKHIRTVVDPDNGVRWFAVPDLSEPLGLSKARLRNKFRDLDGDERSVRNMNTNGGEREMQMVNEPGLLSMILSCPKSRQSGTPAYRYRRWVCHEVLPSIHRTGSYVIRIRELEELLEASQTHLEETQTQLEQSIARLNVSNTHLEESHTLLAENQALLEEGLARLAESQAQKAASEQATEFVETHRLYFVARRILGPLELQNRYLRVKNAFREAANRPLLVWRRSVPYIRRARMQEARDIIFGLLQPME